MYQAAQPQNEIRDPLRICIVTSTYPRCDADYSVPWLRESVHHLVQRDLLLGVDALDGAREQRRPEVAVRAGPVEEPAPSFVR